MSHYLWRLKQDGEISPEEYWDYDLRADLEDAVREELESELSGEETTRKSTTSPVRLWTKNLSNSPIPMLVLGLPSTEHFRWWVSFRVADSQSGAEPLSIRALADLRYTCSKGLVW